MNEPNNDIAGKIIRGENVDVAAALEDEKKNRLRREADAIKLQLLCARMAKAIGRNVEQRTLMASLAIMAAQAICHVHPSRHGRLYVDFLMALKAAIEGTYPKGVRLEPPDMSVLDNNTPDARAAGWPSPTAAKGDASPLTTPVVNGTHEQLPEQLPDIVGHVAPKPVVFKEEPYAGASPPVAVPIVSTSDDLEIPAFLRKSP